MNPNNFGLPSQELDSGGQVDQGDNQLNLLLLQTPSAQNVVSSQYDGDPEWLAFTPQHQQQPHINQNVQPTYLEYHQQSSPFALFTPGDLSWLPEGYRSEDQAQIYDGIQNSLSQNTASTTALTFASTNLSHHDFQHNLVNVPTQAHFPTSCFIENSTNHQHSEVGSEHTGGTQHQAEAAGQDSVQQFDLVELSEGTTSWELVDPSSKSASIRSFSAGIGNSESSGKKATSSCHSNPWARAIGRPVLTPAVVPGPPEHGNQMSVNQPLATLGQHDNSGVIQQDVGLNQNEIAVHMNHVRSDSTAIGTLLSNRKARTTISKRKGPLKPAVRAKAKSMRQRARCLRCQLYKLGVRVLFSALHDLLTF
jgi:hypothetical protein